MLNFWLGLLAGSVATMLLLVITLRLIKRSIPPPPPVLEGWPDLSISLTRELIGRLIDDSLRGVRVPLVSIHDPYVQLAPDAVILLRLRGDTALLGAQPIVLRLRLVRADNGVRVRTEAAEIRGLGNVAGPVTALLDQAINAELARRLGTLDQFDVLNVGGTVDEVTITARLRSTDADQA